jgi:hypothetical protein
MWPIKSKRSTRICQNNTKISPLTKNLLCKFKNVMSMELELQTFRITIIKSIIIIIIIITIIIILITIILI